LAGFSLGGVIGGVVARTMKSASNGRYRADTLVALEPGAVQYGFEPPKAGDANFVTLIYVQRFFGISEATGDAVFNIDGALDKQPNCTKCYNGICADMSMGMCGHVMSQYFWLDAVQSNSPFIYPALSCGAWKVDGSGGWASYLSGACNGNAVGYMNPLAARVPGNFFFRTNRYPPYSRNTPFP
jgi:hypothetical protein